MTQKPRRILITESQQVFTDQSICQGWFNPSAKRLESCIADRVIQQQARSTLTGTARQRPPLDKPHDDNEMSLMSCDQQRQSTEGRVLQLIDQSINPSIDQSIDQSMNQSHSECQSTDGQSKDGVLCHRRERVRCRSEVRSSKSSDALDCHRQTYNKQTHSITV